MEEQVVLEDVIDDINKKVNLGLSSPFLLKSMHEMTWELNIEEPIEKVI